MARATSIETPCKSALNAVKGMPFRWSLNPYRGCVHACHYCYARASHPYLGFNADEEFETRIVVKPNMAEVLRRELARPGWMGDRVAIGTATDAYQPVEGKYQLTRRILAVPRDARNPLSLITKSTLVVRDLDILAELAREIEVRVSFTITTLDRELWRLVEPGTPPPASRLRALARLAVAGLGLLLSSPVWNWLGTGQPSAADELIPQPIDSRSRRHGRPLLLLAAAYFLAGVGYIVAGTFLVAIVRADGASAEAATVAWIVAGLAAAPSALLWSWLATRLTLMMALGVAYLAQAVGLLLLTMGSAAWVAAAILFGGTFVGITSLTLIGGRGMVAAGQATRTIAGLTALFGLGQIIGPLLAAALANDPAGLSRAMPVAAAVVLLGAGLVYAAGRFSNVEHPT